MKISTIWTEKMKFEASADGLSIPMDAKSPIGNDSALTPKQLMIAGLAGCTAMDVVAYLRKHKQPLEHFEVETTVEKSTGGYPEVFTAANLIFKLKGQVDSARVIEAVTLSQTKYCGVSAMLSKAFPVRYRIELNGAPIGEEGTAFPA
jgi:putative redox protein